MCAADAETVNDFWLGVSGQLEQCAAYLDDADQSRYNRLFEIMHADVLQRRGAIWQRMVNRVGELFRPRRWAWNGIYELADGQLELFVACGPPVCASLERCGGIGSSGSCFDALLSNRTLVIPDVDKWGGFVSCDGVSGLQTRASIVVPVRNASGAPVGVWDLDSLDKVTFHDGVLMEALVSFVAFASEGNLRDEDPSSGLR